MNGIEPETELDARYSDPEAVATPWAEGRERLRTAGVCWLSTVRPDGRPHVTPLITVWVDDALHFCTGPAERKARNLEDNPQVALTTGTDALRAGLDVVVEGRAVPVRGDAALRRVAHAYEAKYGSDWHFDVAGGALHSTDGGTAVVFAVAPVTAFGFAKGDYAQTRWRFRR